MTASAPTIERTDDAGVTVVEEVTVVKPTLVTRSDYCDRDGVAPAIARAVFPTGNAGVLLCAHHAREKGNLAKLANTPGVSLYGTSGALTVADLPALLAL